jgi:glycosyltransferase involved in cell wall biosynthesis
MTLAMLSFRLPTPQSKRGGGERVAHDLANSLARHGHEITVWSADPRPEGALYQVRTLPFRALIHNWLGFRLTSGYLGNILALLPDYAGAQVVIAHGDSLLLPLRGIPVLRIMHGSALDESRTAGSWLRKILQWGVYWQERITARTQTTVAISRNTQLRCPAIRELIPNGVDPARFFPAPSEKTQEPSILFVGTLGGRKRGRLLIEWFTERIRPIHPSASLFMVSEAGPPISGVRYFHGIPDEALAALYRKAWVFASPSVYEGFGLPYLEAMASGTAVVATANPGSCEVLDTPALIEESLVESDADFSPRLLRFLEDRPLRERAAGRYEALCARLIEAHA